MFGSVRVDHSLSKNQQMLRRVPAEQRRPRQSRRRRLRSARTRLHARDDQQRAALRAQRADRAEGRARAAGALRVGHHDARRRSRRPAGDRRARQLLDAAAPARTAIAAARRSRSPTTSTGASARSTRFAPALLAKQYWYDSSDLTNFNGTFTFGGLQQYEVGLPTTYHAAHRHADRRLHLLRVRLVRPGHVDALEEALGQHRPAPGDAVAPR